jgi:hypothetical protein
MEYESYFIDNDNLVLSISFFVKKLSYISLIHIKTTGI